MKGDFTRLTFRANKRYTRVHMQQGRVQLDADWNEQVDIQTYQQEAATAAFIGTSGAPKAAPGFAIAVIGGATPDLSISTGRFYADGRLCEVFADASAKYMSQPFLPVSALPSGIAAPQSLTSLGTSPWLVYLDVWSRHVTVLEDAQLREVGLSGPDTTTRTQTVWQVKLVPWPTALAQDATPDFNTLLPVSNAKLAARTNPSATGNTSLAGPNAGYRRLSNQLYRVEIHQGGVVGAAGVSFKWSRDNGSVVAAWSAKSGNDLTVNTLGRDESLGFAIGQWIELTDDTRELHGVSGLLVKIVNVLGNVLTIDPGSATINYVDFPQNPKVRRWDMQSGLVSTTAGSWIPLEEGVEVRFDAATCATGDYWTIPARVATHDVEWPKDANGPLAQDRQGIRHSYSSLAIVQMVSGALSLIRDKRFIFPALTDLRNVDPDLARNLMAAHDHSGSTPDKGPQIGRVGIQNNAIDGSKIDPAAVVTVNQMTVAGAVVNGPLKNQGGLLLNDNPIHLRSSTATSNAIGYSASFAGQSIDGPTAYGNSGGSLGTFQPSFPAIDNAALFDGKDSGIAVNMGTPDWSTAGLSVEAWVRVDAFTNWTGLFEFCNGPAVSSVELVLLAPSTGGSALTVQTCTSAGTYTGDLRVANAVPLGKWTHICMTLDKNGACVIYANGARVGSATGFVAPGTLARTTCLLGRRSWGFSPSGAVQAPLTGALSQVRVWTRILSDADVATKSSPSYVQAANETGLWRYWKLDALTNGKFLNGTATADATGNSDGGTPQGNVQVVSSGQQNALLWDRGNNVTVKGNLFLQQQAIGTSQGPFGTGYARFDGNAANYIQVAGGLPVVDFSGGFTVEAWARWDSFQTNSRIIDFGNGPNNENIVLQNGANTNELYLLVLKGATITNFTVPNALQPGVWMHVCATIDSAGVATIYVNGVQKGTRPGFQLPASVARSLCYIGKSNWGGDSPFQGSMAQVRLWTRALSAVEVKDHSIPSYVPAAWEASLFRAWKLDGLVGGTYPNSAPNGTAHNATPNGATVPEVPGAMNAIIWDAKGNTNVLGDVAFTDRNLYLRAKPGNSWDYNHGLGWYGLGKLWGTRNLDGPALFGYSNGVLGITRNLMATSVLELSGNSGSAVQVALGMPPQPWTATGISIEAWVRWDSFNNWSRIIDFGAGTQIDNIYFANFGLTGDLCLGILPGAVPGTDANQILAPGVLSLGVWTHVCAVVTSAGIAELYVNGVKRAHKTAMPLPNNVARPSSFLGKSNWASDSPFDGALSQVRIWNRVLNYVEVRDRASPSWRPSGSEPGLWRYWTLESLQNGVFKNTAPNNDAADATPQGNCAIVPAPPITALSWDSWGNVQASGYLSGHILQVRSGNSGITLTPGWSGFDSPTMSEISNDTGGYKALMIGGNRALDGTRRRIQMYDDVEVGGQLKVNTSSAAPSGQGLIVNQATLLNGGLTVSGGVATLNSGFTSNATSQVNGALGVGGNFSSYGSVATRGAGGMFFMEDRTNAATGCEQWYSGGTVLWCLPGPYWRMSLSLSTGDLTTIGKISGASKQFCIQHQQKPDHNLVHACIEGPENGAYYRGEAQLENGKAVVELPDYFEWLTSKDQRTVLLTPIFEGDDDPISQLAASKVVDGKFRVRAIDAANPKQRFHWQVMAVRADVPALEVEPLRPTNLPQGPVGSGPPSGLQFDPAPPPSVASSPEPVFMYDPAPPPSVASSAAPEVQPDPAPPPPAVSSPEPEAQLAPAAAPPTPPGNESNSESAPTVPPETTSS